LKKLYERIKYNNFIDSIKFKPKLSTFINNSPCSNDLIHTIKQNEQTRRTSTSSNSSTLASSSSSSSNNNHQETEKKMKAVKKTADRVSIIRGYDLRKKSVESDADVPLPPPPPKVQIPNEVERSIPNLVVNGEKKSTYHTKDLYVYNPIQKYACKTSTINNNNTSDDKFKQLFEKFNIKSCTVKLADAKNGLFKCLNDDIRSIDLDADILKKLNLKSNKVTMMSSSSFNKTSNAKNNKNLKNTETKRKRYVLSSDDSIEKTNKRLTQSKIRKINLNEQQPVDVEKSPKEEIISTNNETSPSTTNDCKPKTSISSISITHLRKINDYFKSANDKNSNNNNDKNDDNKNNSEMQTNMDITSSPKVKDPSLNISIGKSETENVSVLKSKFFANSKFKINSKYIKFF